MATVTIPGLIDPHVHLRDPGEIESEDFSTGTRAALHGGFTTILDMPNNRTFVSSKEVLGQKIAEAKQKIVCDVGFYFGSQGDNLDEFALIANSVFGLKVFLNQTTGGFLIDESRLRAIYHAWPGKKPILVHAEEEKVEAVLRVVAESGKKTHICHIASKFELEKVIQAKEKNLPVTCGATPHHLFLSEEDEKHLGALGKMRPPLQRKSDVDFLWKHLSAIDVVESDHAPHIVEQKNADNPPNGVPGLETTLPLLLTAVGKGRMTLDQLIAMCHSNPAKIFAVPTDPTTEIVIETGIEHEIRNEDLFTKCGWTPFHGMKVTGTVRAVTLHGKSVYADGKILAEPGLGTVITPQN